MKKKWMSCIVLPGFIISWLFLLFAFYASVSEHKQFKRALMGQARAFDVLKPVLSSDEFRKLVVERMPESAGYTQLDIFSEPEVAPFFDKAKADGINVYCADVLRQSHERLPPYVILTSVLVTEPSFRPTFGMPPQVWLEISMDEEWFQAVFVRKDAPMLYDHPRIDESTGFSPRWGPNVVARIR